MNKVLILTLALLLQTGMIEAQSGSDSDTEMSSILITSPRTGLTLYIDDSRIGYVTNDTLSIPAGFHQLSVSDGNSDVWSATDWTWSEELKPDSVYLFEAKIERFTILNTIPFGAKVVIEGSIVTRSAYLLTAASGIAAVWFKFEADKAFNALPMAFDPEDIEYYENRANKYDDLAAISFGTFQIGFLYSIYRAIRN